MLFGQNHEVEHWRPRVAWLFLGLTLACIPVCSAEFLPLTDLPQHLAQIRLLDEAWGLAPRTVDIEAMSVRLFAPNSFVYLPMFLLSRVCEIVLAGKLTVLLILCSSVVSLHVLAARRGRDPLHAVAAGCLLFNLSLYWGLLNFISGLPIFLAFTGRALWATLPQARLRTTVVQAILTLFLLWAHMFWVVCAGLVMLVSVLQGDLRRRLAWHAVSLLPALAALALWYPSLQSFRVASGVQMDARYLSSIAQRIDLEWIASSMLGGIAGAFDVIVALGLVGYAVGTLVSAMRHGSLRIDRELLILGTLLVVFAMLGPDRFFNTLAFSARFLPYGGVLLLLALPANRSKTLSVALAGAMTAFSIATSLSWSMFDQADLSGFRESLAAVSAPKSVLGLDYQPTKRFRDRPTMHLYAYFQAKHGGQLNFSFAEHGSSVVAYRKPRRITWTPTLDWFPKRATVDDVDAFDCVLINADPPTHARLGAHPGLKPVVREGYLRLYCHEGPRQP